MVSFVAFQAPRPFFLEYCPVTDFELDPIFPHYSYPQSRLLKIPVFKLKSLFVFHRAWTVIINMIVEFLQVIHEFLISDNKVWSSLYTYLFFSCLCDWMARAFPFSKDKSACSIFVNSWSLWVLMPCVQIRLYVQ